MKLYGLVDCNNFFVSCERIFRPDLKDRPTVVGGVNDGVVVARSQEAKDLGIPMGVPFFQIKDVIKENNVKTFSVNFELYRDISRRVMSTLREDLDNVYQYSVDEAFFELDLDTEEQVYEQLSYIKDKIEKNIGVPVSLGVGKTMTIAKYACEKEKRGSGVCILINENWTNLTPEIELTDIWGVGSATASKLREHNINKVSDLLEADLVRIEKIFGIHGLRLHSELSEEAAHHPGSRRSTQKSIMSTRSFSSPTHKLADLENAISHHVDRVMTELRQSDSKTGSIRVILGTSRHGDWFLHGKSEEVLLPAPTDDTREVLREVIKVVRNVYDKEVPYKKSGIVISHIQDAKQNQLNLFEQTADTQENSLMSIVDKLKNKWGNEVLTLGRISKKSNNLLLSAQRSPLYTTSWEELKKVRCLK